MTFPPLKSMYLLRGTLITLLLWNLAVGFSLYPTAGIGSPVIVNLAQVFFMLGLFFAPIGGCLYACMKRQEVAVAALIVDDSLPDPREVDRDNHHT